MKKLFAFIFWPALAGLVFAFTLLQAPRLVALMPGLAAYFPLPTAPIDTTYQFASLSDAIRKAAPSVVSINYKETTDRVLYHFTPLGIREQMIQENSNSLGSGVIIREDGYIITSYHVVFTDNQSISGNDITVTLHDGRILEARIVSGDKENDLALLKVDAEQLTTIKQAESSELQEGDLVLAIGNPRNVGQSSTQGIISALWRRGDSFVIQTDAAINPGNSGGALINTNGELIGINSTIVSESGGSEGIGFSVPAEKAQALLDQYLASGPRGYLGVTTAILTLEQGQQLFGQDVQGFLVKEVSINSPADKAGIEVDDVITGFGDARATISSISNLPPGDLILVEVFREGAYLQIPAIPGVGVPQIFNVYEAIPPKKSPPDLPNAGQSN